MLALVSACGGGNEADERGVGAECASADDCFEEGQACLAFRGGYCGIEDCARDADCPDGSACVTHSDGTNYCFLVCGTKSDCNTNRSSENEANCSSSTTFVDGANGRKACIPPST